MPGYPRLDGVPDACRAAGSKPEAALVEIAVAFRPPGAVLADAGYGLSVPFRQKLDRVA